MMNLVYYLTKKATILGMVLYVVFMANLFAQKSENGQSVLTHRKGEIIIKAKPGAKIRVEQQEHEFWFGCAISDGILNGRASENDRKTKSGETEKS